MSEEVKSELTPEQKKALFDTYEKARGKVASASNGLDSAVRAIAASLGHGPFRWQGAEITIVKRGERLLIRTKNAIAEEIG